MTPDHFRERGTTCLRGMSLALIIERLDENPAFENLSFKIPVSSFCSFLSLNAASLTFTEFHNLLKNEVKYTFGCRLGNFESSVHQVQFRRIQFLQQYALLRNAIKTNMTKTYAFILWMNFCVSIVPYPMFIQKVATWCPRIAARTLKTCVNAMVVSIFQVIDLIAETLQRRRLTREYNKHLTPASTTMKLPKSHERYPDFAGND